MNVAYAPPYAELFHKYNKLVEDFNQLLKERDTASTKLMDANYALTKQRSKIEQLESDLRLVRQDRSAIASVLTQCVQVPPAQYEDALIAVLNKWWSEGSDREGLRTLVDRLALPAKLCTLTGLEKVSQSAGWSGPYSFTPSDKDGGWLFCELSRGQAAALPADPQFFVTDAARQPLQRCIVGCENLNQQPVFLQAKNVCKFVIDNEQKGSWKAITMGAIHVKGFSVPAYGTRELRAFESFFMNGRVASQAISGAEQRLPETGTVMHSGIDDDPTSPVMTELAKISQRIASLETKVELLLPAGRGHVEPDQAAEIAAPEEEVQETAPEEWWLPEQLAQSYGASPETNGDYGERLTGLLKKLRETFSLGKVSFAVNHLNLDQERFTIHTTVLGENGIYACESCGPVSDKQLFVTADNSGGDGVWVLMPACSVESYHYPRGYGMLCGPDLPGRLEIAHVTRPAFLRRMSDGRFVVRQTMTWE